MVWGEGFNGAPWLVHGGHSAPLSGGGVMRAGVTNPSDVDIFGSLSTSAAAGGSPLCLAPGCAEISVKAYT